MSPDKKEVSPATTAASSSPNTTTRPIEEEMQTSYLNYAMSVIISRALPDVRDGLKPSQRRIMVAMNDLNLTPRSKFRKCAKIAGDTSGNYHPHGEQVIYPTLVRLAQDFACRYPLIEGQGNFGSIDGDPPAAMRYTEARLSEFAMQIMADLDKNTVDFVPNYDETRIEPKVLPSTFPNLLCNGSSGIAVGMATSIPPHNFLEVADGLIKLLDKPEVTIDELMNHIKGPDFPTGGIICGIEGIKKAYQTGKGLITVRARLSTSEAKGGRKNIIITEIPYNQEKARIISRIATLAKEGKIQGIADIRDESDRDGIRIVVEVKRGEEPEIVVNQLYQNTSLQDTFSIIMIALVNNRPEMLNLKQLLGAFRDHRIEVIRRRTRFLLEKAQAEAHILEGLIIALKNIDAVIKLIKRSKTPEIARQGLMKRFKLSERQAEAILQMRLQKLTGLETEQVIKNLSVLKDKITEYKAILADEGLILDIIREDLYEAKDQYGEARRTDILKRELKEFNFEELISEEEMVVVMSHQGYLKRVPLTSYRKQHRGGKGIIGAETKEGDFIEHIFTASTHDYILFFTDRGRVHWIKVYDLPEMSRLAKGRAIINILKLATNENITAVIPVKDFTTGFLVMATQQGYIKKTPLSGFSHPKKGGIIALKLGGDDKLIGIKITHGTEHIILGTRDGLAIRFPEKDVRSMGRAARGVKAIRLKKGDLVRDIVLVNEKTSLLSVCEKGYGKQTSFKEYRTQRRGGSGIRNIKTTERNGKLIALKEMSDKDDLIMISAKGMIVRIPAKSLRIIGRNTQGVKLISLGSGDQLVSIAKVSKEEHLDEEK